MHKITGAINDIKEYFYYFYQDDKRNAREIINSLIEYPRYFKTRLYQINPRKKNPKFKVATPLPVLIRWNTHLKMHHSIIGDGKYTKKKTIALLQELICLTIFLDKKYKKSLNPKF